MALSDLPCPNSYDVVRVDLATKRVTVMARGKDEANADAVISLAVIRQGAADRFFSRVPANMYRDGEELRGDQ